MPWSIKPLSTYKPKPKDNRPSAHKRGYGKRWQRARKYYLSKNPLCVKCKEQGLTVLAEVVDHIIPHRGDMVLFWDVSNWQGLCTMHHSQKTGQGK